jgi:hypothetical protein
MKSDTVKQYGVVNQALGDANTVTAVVLPDGTYHLYLRGRIADGTAAPIRIHPNPHQSAVFFTVPTGETLHIDRLSLGNTRDAEGKRTRTIFVSSATASAIAEALILS